MSQKPKLTPTENQIRLERSREILTNDRKILASLFKTKLAINARIEQLQSEATLLGTQLGLVVKELEGTSKRYMAVREIAALEEEFSEQIPKEEIEAAQLVAFTQPEAKPAAKPEPAAEPEKVDESASPAA